MPKEIKIKKLKHDIVKKVDLKKAFKQKRKDGQFLNSLNLITDSRYSSRARVACMEIVR